MIEELAKILEDFPGAPNRARCFTHIINLAVKSIMKQFDVPKKANKSVIDEATQELLRLAGDIEDEEESEEREHGLGPDVEEDEEVLDNVDGWVDERERLTAEELKELEEAVRPVRFVLTKVCFPNYTGANIDLER